MEKTYSLYFVPHKKVTHDDLKVCDCTIKSGLCEHAFDDVFEYHSLNNEDIVNAINLVSSLFEVSKSDIEIHEEIWVTDTSCNCEFLGMADKLLENL